MRSIETSASDEDERVGRQHDGKHNSPCRKNFLLEFLSRESCLQGELAPIWLAISIAARRVRFSDENPSPQRLLGVVDKFSGKFRRCACSSSFFSLSLSFSLGVVAIRQAIITILIPTLP